MDASGLIGGMGGGNHDSGPEGDYAFFGDGSCSPRRCIHFHAPPYIFR